jgi:hypothetical protein
MRNVLIIGLNRSYFVLFARRKYASTTIHENE